MLSHAADLHCSPSRLQRSLLLHRLHRHRTGAESIRPNADSYRNDYAHAYSNPHPNAGDLHGHRYQYTYAYSDTDKYRTRTTHYIDSTFSLPLRLHDIDAILDAIADSFAHAFMDTNAPLPIRHTHAQPDDTATPTITPFP